MAFAVDKATRRLCSDRYVAVDDVAQAVLGFTEVKLGLIPAVISPFVMEKIGAAHGARWFLTGERFTASQAKQMGAPLARLFVFV